MAELLVPGIINRLGDIALRQLGERMNLVTGVEEEVRNLSMKFITLEKVLHDAEGRRLKEKDIGIWLEKLEDIAYEMEDLLDEWKIKVLRPQAATVPTVLEKVRAFISSPCSCPKQVLVRSDIALKIKDINDMLELTLKEANQFNFVTSNWNGEFNSNEFRRPFTISVFDESEVHGREFDKNSLLEHLMSEGDDKSNNEKQGKDHGVEVISIVGAGGIGKTTLSQMLYNDESVKKYFELRKWVCVSGNFNEKRIANALLESPEKSDYSSMSELESLFQLIRDCFSGKKFLVVLDDVWTEDYSKWKPFRDSLKDGAPGSKILVTTRNQRVARALGTHYNHNLGLLSDLDCWLIVKRIALSRRHDLCERVEKIGWKIAEKCKGLPLAAKTMGSLLQFKDNMVEWQRVLYSEIWHMEEAVSDLFPHFYLSYKELSPQLQRCFSYCAIFPKDSIIDVAQLIRLWMAQGYLGSSSPRGDNRTENNGLEYFKNLEMRSFFQYRARDETDQGRTITCKMHGMVHDFAQFISKNEFHTFDEADCEQDYGRSSYKERARHVRWLRKIGTLRSVVVDSRKVRSVFITRNGEVFQDLFWCLKCVRSLTLSYCGLRELADEVGNLIHLRYLDVSHNPLKELPETICDLYYLETFDISDCNRLSCLPQRIGDLVQLRHLLNPRTHELLRVPKGLEKLSSICTLSGLNVGGTCNDVAMLKSLNQVEDICISIHGLVDFEKAEMGKKILMQNLRLCFYTYDWSTEDSSWVEVIQPPPNLKKLKLWCFPLPHLPKWILANCLVTSLTSLTLSLGFKISSLPGLGKLVSLEFLSLIMLSNLKCLGREFYGLPERMHATVKDNGDDDHQAERHSISVEFVAFPSLRILDFRLLEELEMWEDLIGEEDDDDEKKVNVISAMPRLEMLGIHGCEKLEKLPHRILGKTSSLKKLEIDHCPKLAERYSDKRGEDWMKISHVPHVNMWP